MIRGDIYMLDFGIPFESEPGYRRPVIIIQSNKENLDNLNNYHCNSSYFKHHK